LVFPPLFVYLQRNQRLPARARLALPPGRRLNQRAR
jgi:hypothetical protein